MRRITFLVLVVLTGLLSAACASNRATAHGGHGVEVTVYHADGRRGGAFVPRVEPYQSPDGPAVTLYVPYGTRAKTADGDWIVGVKFLGWMEPGGTVLVQEYLMTLDDESAKSGATEENARATLLAYDRLSDSSLQPVNELQTFGIAPMKVSLVAGRR